jgi:molybdopterin converting factor small subunit
MKVKVLFFAQLRDVFGEAETFVDAEEGATAGELSRTLLNGLSPAELTGIPLLLAVNENFVEPEDVLKNGDTLALMTPVSGG